MSASSRSFAQGELVAGRYRVVSLLDAGGMGEVFVAYDEQLEHEVALKAMRRALQDDAAFRERFRREAMAATRVSHASVVQVFEHGEHQGVPFMVSELLAGHSLRERIAAAGRLQPGFAARIGGDIADAVYAAHCAGVIHRDLKPANVFLADIGQSREIVKVLDFGVAKLLDGELLTRSADFVGTPAYTAPEQLLDTRAVTPQSDLWSIACIVYEMVTGRTPFAAPSYQELIARILHDDPEPASRWVPELRPALDAVLQRALRKQPAQRFATAAELARALYVIAAEHEQPIALTLAESGHLGTKSQLVQPSQSAASSTARTADLAETLAPRPSFEPDAPSPTAPDPARPTTRRPAR